MGACVRAMAFPVPEADPELITALRARPEFLWLETEEGLRIAAIHIRQNSARTVLYSHGNAEDISMSLRYLDVMAACLSADVLAYDYPGYGISDGSPSEEGCYSCAEAAYQHLVQVGTVPARIVAWGRSIGSGPTVDLVSRHEEIGGMVLQSPLESGGRAACSCCGCGHFVSAVCYCNDIFRNYEKIEDVSCPVLVMHGTADKVVPYHNGQALHAACENAVKPVWFEGCGHNDLPVDVCLENVRYFIDNLEQTWEEEKVPRGPPGQLMQSSVVGGAAYATAQPAAAAASLQNGQLQAGAFVPSQGTYAAYSPWAMHPASQPLQVSFAVR
eukprot:TRINITY_DN23980_c0_g1_i1.p1 TRINITY_DN23980_c0_g1~~TRINITY_DN23980_c0_g1_i1.p1  ORF type:complete len:329 (+),score=58.17 TRINITY_DN23980_c0_g1_i1:46-1032(+)